MWNQNEFEIETTLRTSKNALNRKIAGVRLRKTSWTRASSVAIGPLEEWNRVKDKLESPLVRFLHKYFEQFNKESVFYLQKQPWNWSLLSYSHKIGWHRDIEGITSEPANSVLPQHFGTFQDRLVVDPSSRFHLWKCEDNESMKQGWIWNEICIYFHSFENPLKIIGFCTQLPEHPDPCGFPKTKTDLKLKCAFTPLRIAQTGILKTSHPSQLTPFRHSTNRLVSFVRSLLILISLANCMQHYPSEERKKDEREIRISFHSLGKHQTVIDFY